MISFENIRFSDDHKNNSFRIVLDLTHKAPYSVFTLNNKPRLVVDIETKKIINKLKNSSDFINNIRSNQTDKNVTRIVFDLKKFYNVDFSEEKYNNTFRMQNIKQLKFSVDSLEQKLLQQYNNFSNSFSNFFIR